MLLNAFQALPRTFYLFGRSLGHPSHLEFIRVELSFSGKYWLTFSYVYENGRFPVTSFHHYFRKRKKLLVLSFTSNSQISEEKCEKLALQIEEKEKNIENKKNLD